MGFVCTPCPPPLWERQLCCTGLVLDWNMCQSPVKTMRRTTTMWSRILHIRRQTHNTKQAKGNYFTTSNVESSVRDRNTNASESVQQCLRQCKHTIDVFRRFCLGWDTVVSCSLYGCRSQHSSGWQSALVTAWVQTCWLEFDGFPWINPKLMKTSLNRQFGFQLAKSPRNDMLQTCGKRRKTSLRMVRHFQYWEFKGLHNRLTHANTQNWRNWKRHISCSTQQTLQLIVPYCFLSMFHWTMLEGIGAPTVFFCSTLSTQSAGAGICLSGCHNQWTWHPSWLKPCGNADAPGWPSSLSHSVAIISMVTGKSAVRNHGKTEFYGVLMHQLKHKGAGQHVSHLQIYKCVCEKWNACLFRNSNSCVSCIQGKNNSIKHDKEMPLHLSAPWRRRKGLDKLLPCNNGMQEILRETKVCMHGCMHAFMRACTHNMKNIYI